MRVAPFHLGPPEHGVTRYGRQLARAVATQPGVSLVGVDDGPDVVHAHVSDHLWGGADRFEALRSRAPAACLVVTLHDVPQAGEHRFDERRRTYGRVAATADVVVVASRHEAAALDRPAAVIPLLVEAVAGRPSPAPDGCTVAVLGYLYPGKGHEEVVDACAEVGGVRLACLGRTSDGHEDLAPALRARAEAAGVELEVTGWLPDAALRARLASAAVPVAPHRQVSASGSIATWLAAGRRPLARAGGYVDELAASVPGAVARYSGPDLAAAVVAALADPSTTIGDGVPAHLRPEVVAARHVEVYRS